VAFEFRFKAETSRHLWDKSFHYGSLLATFSQGIVLGAFVQGVRVEGRQYAGGMLDWLTPFSLMCGVALVFGYALLGATWLVWRTGGGLQAWARRTSRLMLLAVILFVGIVSLWTPLLNETIAARWFTMPNLVLLSPVPLVTAGLALWLWRASATREVLPFVLAIGLFTLSYLGLAISLWPMLIPPDISIWQAASPPETQTFLLVGMSFLLPTLIAYTIYCYWVFRGKVTAEGGYHH
jgi:cytochrome bd ubiquinol oxidase subunit II